MGKPSIFFDTCVCIDLAKWGYADWSANRALGNLNDSFQYCISPLTLYELCVGLARGAGEFFEENRKPVHALYGTSSARRFLSLPGQFVLATILNRRDLATALPPSEVRRIFEIVFASRNKSQLTQGKILLPLMSNRTFGLDIKLIERQVNEGKKLHAAELQALRRGELQVPSPQMWARGVSERMHVQPSREQDDALACSLTAAYKFDAGLWRMAATQSYDFERHGSDWIDGQQLYYLSKADMHFVTNEQRKFIARIGTSSQNDRILSYDQLVRRLQS